MAIVNSVKTLFPGAGNVTEYVSLLAQAVTAGTATAFTLTGFVNYVRSGKIRVKTTAAPASSTITGIVITGTDGTTTVTLGSYAYVATTAAQLVDLLFEFISELNLTTVTVTITEAGGTAPTADIELAGNP